MQVKYDSAVDALYVYFTHEAVARTEVIREDEATADYDSHGELIGVEILDPSDGVNLDGLPRSAEIGKLLESLRFPIYA